MHDVIVIGAGFAGCAAAREVRRAGKSPIIIEDMPMELAIAELFHVWPW